MKKVVVLISILFIAVFVVAYFVVMGVSKNATSDDAQGTPESTQSVSAFDKYVGFELGKNYWSKANEFFDPNFSQDWDYKKDMVSANILKVDRPGHKLSIKIGLPEGKEFSEKTITIPIECPNNQNTLVGANLKLIKNNFDLFDEAKKGDKIFTYCLDDQCLAAGVACVLSRNINE